MSELKMSGTITKIMEVEKGTSKAGKESAWSSQYVFTITKGVHNGDIGYHVCDLYL